MKPSREYYLNGMIVDDENEIAMLEMMLEEKRDRLGQLDILGAVVDPQYIEMEELAERKALQVKIASMEKRLKNLNARLEQLRKAQRD